MFSMFFFSMLSAMVGNCTRVYCLEGSWNLSSHFECLEPRAHEPAANSRNFPSQLCKPSCFFLKIDPCVCGKSPRHKQSIQTPLRVNRPNKPVVWPRLQTTHVRHFIDNGRNVKVTCTVRTQRPQPERGITYSKALGGPCLQCHWS